MPKPSNAALLAERKAIRALLDVDENVTTLDAVTALNNEVVRLRAVLRSAGAPPVPIAIPLRPDRIAGETETPILADARLEAAETIGPVIDPKDIEKKPVGVAVDTAQYPGFSKPLPPPAAHEMSPVQGDLTPSYTRWLLAERGPAFMREKYPDRLHLLPEDVRRALA